MKTDNLENTTIQLHPKNPRYFIYKGKPLVLITATEHYGSVLNKNFDYVRYLYETYDKRQTLTRCFLLFRELESPDNPYSPCKPQPYEYLSPFPRTGPGEALDGLPKFNLDEWDAVYFDRLHSFLSLASKYDIIVELVLFSNTYGDPVWSLNPFNAKNNINNIGNIHWQEYNTMREEKLFNKQKEYVKKIVREVNRYDNIYFEVCNEPGVINPDYATVEEIKEWQDAIRALIRNEEAKLPKQHLIFEEPVFSPQEYRVDEPLHDKSIDAVNIHNSENTSYQGVSYPTGRFMRKDVRLKAIHELWIACYKAEKPLIFDEDNAASKYRDAEGWTIQRKRAWITVMSGGHYDFIDFSIQANGLETGTAESRRMLRTWMKNLSTFIHSIDFINMKPIRNFPSLLPPNTLAATLANHGKEYVIYLADSQEINMPSYGWPRSGDVIFELPKGLYEARFYSPAEGEYLPSKVMLEGDGQICLSVPLFTHDIVIHIKRVCQ